MKGEPRNYAKENAYSLKCTLDLENTVNANLSNLDIQNGEKHHIGHRCHHVLHHHHPLHHNLRGDHLKMMDLFHHEQAQPKVSDNH